MTRRELSKSEDGTLKDFTVTEQGENYAFSFAEGTEPKSIETQSYAGGVKRIVNKVKKKVKAVKKNKAAQNKQNADTVKALSKDDKIVMPKSAGDPKEKGMSMGMKVGIGAAIAIALGAGVYMFVKHKKK